MLKKHDIAVWCLLCFWILQRYQSFGQAASFYGSSYISVSLQEARSTSDISFRFKTSRPDALLLLAAGRTDYCLVVLQGGTLKVRINLGAGEGEVATAHSLRLDDLKWHQVRLHRKDADFTLSVDGVHSTKLRLPGRFYELNIHYGLFVGGLGGFREIFLGLWDNFRGCIDDLHYNGIEVLARVRDKSIQADAFSVTWECSAEFDASSQQDISFLEKDSYMTLANSMAKSGSLLQLALKTITRETVLFYATGPLAKPDFVAIELIEGHLRVSTDNGAGILDVFSDVAVSDGSWHNIQVQVNVNSIDLSVDGHSNNVRSAATASRYFELGGSVYLGGIESSKTAVALKQGLRAANSSLRGCVRQLHIDGKLFGLREARATRNVAPDCAWDYPCTLDPCVDDAVCTQDGLAGFRCTNCRQPPCTKPEFAATSSKVVTKTGNLDEGLEVLNLSTLQVQEGGNVSITSKELGVVFDYKKFGIRESGILFHVVRPPQHGRLFSSLWSRADEATFTLLDVHADRLRYVHDGSETTRDTVTLELELASRADYLLPAYLQKRQRFVLQISVTPVNDPPELSIPPGKILRLVKNSRKPLTEDLLNARDPDNLATDLTYTLLPSSGNEAEGFIESSVQPGLPLTKFTQEDVNEGRIFFVHRGTSQNGRLTFQVSDGMESGGIGVLRISAFDLQIFLVNNTGLIVPINGSSFVTPYNLTFATNAPDQSFDIKFDITQNPQFGSLQKFKQSSAGSTTSGRWQVLTTFTSTQLQRERIRYIHTSGNPTQDEFKFTVSVPEVQSRPSTVYDFRIQFLSATLRAEKNEILVIKAAQEATITNQLLKFNVDSYTINDDDIVFTILEPPQYGHLFLGVPGQEYSKWQRLTKGAKVTQAQINSSRLQYRLSRRTLTALRDSFHFQPATTFLSPPAEMFRIAYVPAPALSGSVTMETVTVNEGESAPIRNQHLNIRDVPVVLYNVSKLPSHGTLNLLDLSRRQVSRRNITSFTSDEVADERIVYTHDDSETTADDIEFSATPRDPVSRADLDFQAMGRLHFSVQMKNDNPPYRIVDRVFHVVTNGERVLSSSVLRYGDPDINTSPSSIVYNRRGISNGMLFHSDKRDAQVYEFTQEDIDAGKIIFKHQGVPYGKVALWVSDGQFHATGVLQVQASEPFLEISNNSALTVKRGSSTPLTTENLGISSNVDFEPEQLKFVITEVPEYGILQKNGSKIDSFTLADVLENLVVYSINNSLHFKDKFKFRTILKDLTELEGSLQVRIFPESYWEPLRIVNNKVLEVEESTRVTIDQSALKVLHPNIVPTDIVYYVHQPPLNGYLEIDHDEDYDIDETTTHGLPPEVSVFDQSIINDNRLHYIQSAANQSSDFFIFDVTNGIVTVRNVTFHLFVIPKLMILDPGRVSVMEGGQSALLPSDLRIVTQYYENKVDEFFVNKPPVHGTLRWKQSSEAGQVVSRFTPAQLAAKQIVYIHDGSEDRSDSVEVIAIAGKKESVPATLTIQIEPVDDERPLLVNNTGLLVWEGSTTLIESNILGALDVDTPLDSLMYSFSKGDCGYFIANNNTRQAATNFSQKMINDKRVSFVHSGKPNCSIIFSLTDTHTGNSQHSLVVTARKLQLLLSRNTRLHVFPMMQQSITSSHLLAITSDFRADRNPRFKVTRSPRLGRLLLEQPDGSTKLTSSFTQRDLNQSLVIYEHTEPFADLTVNDVFTFTVSADWTAPLEDREFFIEVSVATMAEGGLDRYLGLKPLELEEGGLVTIQESNFNISGIVQFISSHRAAFAMEPPKLRLVLSTSPQHGFLSVDSSRVDSGTEISLKDISLLKVQYRHDNSDTVRDSLGFSIYLQRDNELKERHPDILLYNGTLKVTVFPVNDEPFVLLTKAPSMQVVQRQSRIITPDILLTEDADTSPRDLIYEVIQPPARGKLVFVNSTSGSVDRFTQEDVNQNRLIYAHDGSMEPTFFYFKVSDGQFKPVSGVFSIQVVALTLSLVNNTAIRIQQGHTTAVILNSSLAAESNGQRRHIFYNITQEPQFGKIYVNDGTVTTFGQINIDKEEVLYAQQNLTAAWDYFEITLWTLEVSIPKIIVNISVAPLVKQRPVPAVIGEKTAITAAYLDASALALLTNSNPVFQIIRKPRYGKFRRIIPTTSRNKRQNKEKDTALFTHEDVLNEFIYYVIRRMDTNESVTDSCEYLLTAPNVQPASGILEFSIAPSGTLVAESKSGVDVLVAHGASSAGNRKTAKANDNAAPAIPDIVSENSLPGSGVGADVVLIVGVVCGVLALVLAILIVLRCKSKQQTRKNRKQQLNDPNGDLQLERLTNSLKNGHKKSRNLNFEVTDAYRSHHSGLRSNESEGDSDPEPPPPPRLEHLDAPLSPRPCRAKRVASPGSGTSTMSSLPGSKKSRASWYDSARDTPPSVPQCKIIPLHPLIASCDASEASDVNMRYPYGVPDDSLEEWAMLDSHSDVRYTPRTTNPMLRKNQYWV